PEKKWLRQNLPRVPSKLPQRVAAERLKAAEFIQVTWIPVPFGYFKPRKFTKLKWRRSHKREWTCIAIMLMVNTNFEDLCSALEDGKVEGALLDTYIAAEHKDELFNDKIFVKEILDRPFGYGVFLFLSEAAVNMEQ
ncbi:hypothetical protein pdam_00019070, partial [Pocillopora damicornis]